MNTNTDSVESQADVRVAREDSSDGTPTREQLLTEAVLNAQKAKWDGWNWKEYQKTIVRLNWRISQFETGYTNSKP